MRTISQLHCGPLTTLWAHVFNSALGSSEIMGDFDNAEVCHLVTFLLCVKFKTRALELKSG